MTRIDPVDELGPSCTCQRYINPRTDPAMTTNSGATDRARGELRRQQVLDAAAACFREHGFHGTSIQRISQAVGMSPGHIYHYFENKEFIVAGIVEHYLHETLEIVGQVEEASKSIGLVEAITAHVETSIALRSGKKRVSLDLEILAEASRNPVIAEALRHADKSFRSRMRDLLLQSLALRSVPKAELDARITVMSTLFDGLSTRTLCDPTLSKSDTTRVIERVLRVLFEEPK